MTTRKDREAIVALRDGESYTDTDGRTWTMKIVPDEISSIFDEQGEGVWCGKLEWSHQTNAYGWTVRPDGFDGNAEILERDHRSALWWQPLEDCKPNSETRRLVREAVLDCLRYGYVGIMLKTDDGYRDSLFGIEPFPDDAMVRATVEDLYLDIRVDMERDAVAKARAMGPELFAAAIR